MKAPGGAANAPRCRNDIALSDRCNGHHHPRGATVGTGASPMNPLRAGWRHLKSLNARVEDSWVGDLLGALSLSATLIVLLFIGAVLS